MSQMPEDSFLLSPSQSKLRSTCAGRCYGSMRQDQEDAKSDSMGSMEPDVSDNDVWNSPSDPSAILAWSLTNHRLRRKKVFSLVGS